MLYIYIAFITFCETTAISFLKQYAQSAQPRYFFMGLLFYGAVSLLLTYSFAFEGMGIVNAMWSVFSVIFVASIGALEFHEHMTKHQVIGMILAIAGIVILRL